jgi:hypothetical protein
LQRAFYLQAAVFRQGYDNFGLLRPVGQNLGGFQKLKDGGGLPGGEDHPVPPLSGSLCLAVFPALFLLYDSRPLGVSIFTIEDRFPLKGAG